MRPYTSGGISNSEYGVGTYRNALDYLDVVDPTLVYLASPYAHPSAAVREARLEAVRYLCGQMVNQGRIVMSPLVYLGELAYKGVHPPQGWYAFDLQLLARCHSSWTYPNSLLSTTWMLSIPPSSISIGYSGSP